jgi:hypothetical protein
MASLGNVGIKNFERKKYFYSWCYGRSKKYADRND